MLQRRILPALACVTALALSLVATPPQAAAAEAPGPFVSEIVAANEGADDFEYFEVNNPTSSDVTLGGEGLQFAYIYADDADRQRDVALEFEAPVTLRANETAVLWLSYTDEKVDSYARTVDEFRSYHSVPDSTSVVRVAGQPGMENGGDRGIRVLDGETVLGWSFYPAGSVETDQAAQFRAPAQQGSAAVLQGPAERSPGVVSPEQLASPDPEPEPAPEPKAEAEPEAQPQPDPNLRTAPLQITEVLPDSENIDKSDAYEFIEIYNSTTEPINLADYRLVYATPQNETTNEMEAYWQLVPEDAVVASGATVVIWVKNGKNDDLTADDFNAKFSTNLVSGENLLETFVPGLFNGAARALAIRTNSGFDVNRAYYNMKGEKDVAADRSIRYRVRDDEPELQAKLAADQTPTPGSVQADQVPSGLMVVPADSEAPVIANTTGDTIDPSKDWVITVEARDNVQVRTVTLDLSNDVDEEVRSFNLERDPDDPSKYSYTVSKADLLGKSEYRYTVTADDGTNDASTGEARARVEGVNTDPLRLSVADGQYVSGMTEVSAAGQYGAARIDLSIGGASVSTKPALESEPNFVFEESQTDFAFRNGVRMGDDILYIFENGSYGDTVTHGVPIAQSYFKQGSDLTPSIWAGTKNGPWIDEEQNNDDFVISGMRLVLPDGRTLRPAGYDDPTKIIQMGDSPGTLDSYDAVFTIPDDAYVAASNAWDTRALPDGPIEIQAAQGEERASATVIVDNTPPEITPSVSEGELYQGTFALDADIRDAGSGVESVTATLNGEEIELGTTTSSLELGEGEHVFEVVATDALGNESRSTVRFRVPEEMPSSDMFSPADGAEVAPGDVTLQARVTDPTNDPLDVTFYEGYRYTADDAEVSGTSGTVRDAAAVERDGATGTEAISSSDEFPYYRFDVDVPDGIGDDAQVRLSWTGQANEGAQLQLMALTADGSAWTPVFEARSDGGEVTLSGTVPTRDFVKDGKVSALVQHSKGYAGENLSTRDTAVTGGNPGDVPRSDYDFTIAWQSDTQYYNEEFPQQLTNMNDYLLKRRADLNLQYMLHTGDVVDDSDQPYQWDNADAEYKRLDEAGLPYQLLAGNHDVGMADNDYSEYVPRFGSDRYADQPWFGGSFEDGRGQYQLISSGGIDFLMLSMGWGADDSAIKWMNDVLAQYPDRVAVLNSHEYIQGNGELTAVPQRIKDEVVATNSNVRMVLSGHYHDDATVVDNFDDDGDGVAERSVYSLLFDYQSLPEGGSGYMRLLHFDNEGQRMMVRTYSPSLDRYNSDDPSLIGPEDDPYGTQEFDISYADLGISPVVRQLSSTSFEAEVLTERAIGKAPAAQFPGSDSPGAVSLRAAASDNIARTTWTLTQPGEYGWYVRTSDPYGAVDNSAVQRLTVTGGADPAPTDPPGPTEPGPNQPGPNQPGDQGPGGAGDPPRQGPGAGGGQLPPTGGTTQPLGALIATFMIAVGAMLLARSRRHRHGAASHPQA